VELAEGPLEGFGTGVEDEEGKAVFWLAKVG
jgi:isoleucyl-tRNA synthetase